MSGQGGVGLPLTHSFIFSISLCAIFRFNRKLPPLTYSSSFIPKTTSATS